MQKQRPATPKQLALIAKLGGLATAEMGVRDASVYIDRLLMETPARPAFAPGRFPAVAEDAVTECGMYRMADGTICKVQKSKLGGNLYAKRLVQIGGQRLTELDVVVQFEFQYEAGLVRQLKASQRLSEYDAKQFGIRFGVCCVCGITLKDAESVAAGIGPVCAKRL